MHSSKEKDLTIRFVIEETEAKKQSCGKDVQSFLQGFIAFKMIRSRLLTVIWNDETISSKWTETEQSDIPTKNLNAMSDALGKYVDSAMVLMV